MASFFASFEGYRDQWLRVAEELVGCTWDAIS